MLKINHDNSLTIVLVGQNKINANLLIAGILGIFALIVVYLAVTQTTPIAIGAIFALAVACFCFNLYKEKLKNQPIYGGTIIAKAGQLDLNGQLIRLSQTAQIQINNDLFIIQDKNNTWQIGGFENEKEMVVLKAVLQGEQIGKKLANIKMQG